MRFNDFLLEHNIYNLDKLTEWLTGFTMDLNTEAGKNWYLKTLKKQIINTEHPEKWLDLMKSAPAKAPSWAVTAIKRGELYQFDPRKVPTFIKEELEHIGDYIRWLEDNNERELNKIIKQSFEIMSAKTEQWVATINRKAAKKEKQRLKDTGVSEEEGVNIVMKWADGWFIVQLMTAETCSREGALTGHCVASYGQRAESGEIELYSLRDPDNQPHVTMEVRDNELHQIKGRHNKPPGPDHIPFIKDFVLARNFDVRGDYKNIGLWKLGEKLWDPEKEMPDIVDGHVWLNKFSGKLNFPKKFEVKGGLYLSDTVTVGDFPDNLKVFDELDIENSNVSKLPSKLWIGGAFHLAGSNVNKLPEGLYVGEDMNASETKIKRLPEKFKILAGIDMENSLVEYIPPVHILDYLDITNTKVRTLPKGLVIEGNLYCSGTGVTKEKIKKWGVVVKGRVED